MEPDDPEAFESDAHEPPHGDPLLEEEMHVYSPEVLPPQSERFYDRLRRRMTSYLASKAAPLGPTAEFLMFVPDVFVLLVRLARDERVTGKNKVLLGTGIAYFIFPLDIIPEAIVGPIGYLDDLVFSVYILNKILIETDEAVLHEHWSGRGNVLHMMRDVLQSADKLVTTDVLGKIRKLFK